MAETDARGDRRELTEQLRLLSEVDATQTALFQQAAAAHYGLTVTDMKALSILLRDGPQTAGALGVALNLTSGAVTGVVNRLEQDGLVHRGQDDGDKRKVVVSVDESALAERENVYLGIGTAFERLYADYSSEELRFLARHLAASIDITRAETAALRRRDDLGSPASR